MSSLANAEGPALDGPAPDTNQAVRLLTTMVDLLSRYSNHEAELGTLFELLERLRTGDQTAAPGLPAATLRPTPDPSRRKVVDRLPEGTIAAMVKRFRAGATIQALANEYGISESSIKRLLRKYGVHRHRQRPYAT